QSLLAIRLPSRKRAIQEAEFGRLDVGSGQQRTTAQCLLEMHPGLVQEGQITFGRLQASRLLGRQGGLLLFEKPAELGQGTNLLRSRQKYLLLNKAEAVEVVRLPGSLAA